MDNYEFLDDPGLKKILVLIIKYVEESIKELNGSGIYGGGTNIYDSNAVKDTLRDVNGNDFYFGGSLCPNRQSDGRGGRYGQFDAFHFAG